MPDTKSGRERKGRNKRRQLTERLYRRELDALERDEEPDLTGETVSADDLLADEPSEEPTD
jgi:hypothetical protein